MYDTNTEKENNTTQHNFTKSEILGVNGGKCGKKKNSSNKPQKIDENLSTAKKKGDQAEQFFVWSEKRAEVTS